MRPATPQDASAIARVHVQSWEETYRGLLPDAVLDAQRLDKRTAAWSRWLEREQTYTYVVTSNEEIVAFASAYEDRAEPGFDSFLSTLYVLRRAQQGGLARGLLRAIAQDLLALDRRSMWLLTLRDRNPARAFYERLGARLIREQPAPTELGEGTIDVVYGFDDLRALI